MSENEGPTPSRQTNRLIAMCQQVAAGGEDEERLRIYLEERREGLRQAREDFLARCRREDEDFQELFREEVDGVLAQFELYDRAMEEVSLYFSDRDPVHLQEGSRALVEVTADLLEALQLFDHKYMTWGPTRYPVVNILKKVLPALQRGEFPREEFRRMVEGAQAFFTRAAEEVSDSVHDAVPGIDLRRQGIQGMLEGIGMLERYLQDGDTGHLDAGLGRIGAAHEQIEEAFALFRDEHFLKGPSPSPLANWLIHAAEGVKGGQFPPGVLEQAADWFAERVAEIRTRVEELAQSPTSSVVIQEELPRTVECFDLLEEATEELRAAATRPESIDPPLEKLRGAVEQLAASEKVYQEVAEREGRLICPECGHPNASEARVCDGCGASLPRLMAPEYSVAASSTFELMEQGGQAADELAGMPMTDNLKRLFDACEAVHSGAMSAEQFASILDWANGLLRTGESQLAALPTLDTLQDVPEEERESFEEQKALLDETRALLQTGIDEFREGLARMQAYLDSPDRDHLVAGIRIVWEGAQKLYQCQMMGQAVEEAEAQASAAEEPEPATLLEEEDRVDIRLDSEGPS